MALNTQKQVDDDKLKSGAEEKEAKEKAKDFTEKIDQKNNQTELVHDQADDEKIEEKAEEIEAIKDKFDIVDVSDPLLKERVDELFKNPKLKEYFHESSRNLKKEIGSLGLSPEIGSEEAEKSDIATKYRLYSIALIKNEVHKDSPTSWEGEGLNKKFIANSKNIDDISKKAVQNFIEKYDKTLPSEDVDFDSTKLDPTLKEEIKTVNDEKRKLNLHKYDSEYVKEFTKKHLRNTVLIDALSVMGSHDSRSLDEQINNLSREKKLATESKSRANNDFDEIANKEYPWWRFEYFSRIREKEANQALNDFYSSSFSKELYQDKIETIKMCHEFEKYRPYAAVEEISENIDKSIAKLPNKDTIDVYKLKYLEAHYYDSAVSSMDSKIENNYTAETKKLLNEASENKLNEAKQLEEDFVAYRVKGDIIWTHLLKKEGLSPADLEKDKEFYAGHGMKIIDNKNISIDIEDREIIIKDFNNLNNEFKVFLNSFEEESPEKNLRAWNKISAISTSIVENFYLRRDVKQVQNLLKYSPEANLEKYLNNDWMAKYFHDEYLTRNGRLVPGYISYEDRKMLENYLGTENTEKRIRDILETDILQKYLEVEPGKNKNYKEILEKIKAIFPKSKEPEKLLLAKSKEIFPDLEKKKEYKQMIELHRALGKLGPKPKHNVLFSELIKRGEIDYLKKNKTFFKKINFQSFELFNKKTTKKHELYEFWPALDKKTREKYDEKYHFSTYFEDLGIKNEKIYQEYLSLKESNDEINLRGYIGKIKTEMEEVISSDQQPEDIIEKENYKILVQHVYPNNTTGRAQFDGIESCTDRSEDLKGFRIKDKYEITLSPSGKMELREKLNDRDIDDTYKTLEQNSTSREMLDSTLDEHLLKIENKSIFETTEEKIFALYLESIVNNFDQEQLKNLVTQYYLTQYPDENAIDEMIGANRSEYTSLISMKDFYSNNLKEVPREITKKSLENEEIRSLVSSYFEKRSAILNNEAKKDIVLRTGVNKLGLNGKILDKIEKQLRGKGKLFTKEGDEYKLGKKGKAIAGMIRGSQSKIKEAIEGLTGETIEDPSEIHLGTLDMEEYINSEVKIIEGEYDEDLFLNYLSQSFEEVYRDEIEILDREIQKFSSVSGKSEQAKAIECFITKNHTSAHARATAGVCVAGDNPNKSPECLWNMPNYLQMVFKDKETSKCQGMALLHYFEDKSEKVLSIGPNPSSTFLYKVDQEQFFEKLFENIVVFAEDNNFDRIVISDRPGLVTNRNGTKFEDSINAKKNAVHEELGDDSIFDFSEPKVFSYDPPYKADKMHTLWKKQQ